MSTATKKRTARKPTLRTLGREVSALRSRIEELEDLHDLKAAVVRNGSKAGVPWTKAKASLGLA